MYPDMAELLVPAACGDWKIEHFDVDNSDVHAKILGVVPGKYVRLTYKGEIVMSNTPMEKRTNTKFCTDAHGDVLIGGLGLGMIVLAIQDEVDVKSITIIEKYSEVIELVTSQIKFNEKVRIIQGDVFEWKPEKWTRFDCIYMDVWSYINSDVYQNEMMPVKRKWSHYLKPRWESPYRFVRCWAELEAKRNMRLT